MSRGWLLGVPHILHQTRERSPQGGYRRTRQDALDSLNECFALLCGNNQCLRFRGFHRRIPSIGLCGRTAPSRPQGAKTRYLGVPFV